MGKDKKIIELIKGSAVLVVANVIIKCINFFLLPLYTKYLTPNMLGISDTASTAASLLLPILVLGLDSAFSAFYYDEHTDEHINRVFDTIWFTLLISSLIPIIIAMFSNYISKMMYGNYEYGLLVGTMLVSVSFNMWYMPFALLVRMQKRMVLFAAINITASLVMIVLNIVFVSVIKLGAYSLIASTAIVQLVQLLLYLKLSKFRISHKYFDTKLLKKMLKYSLPLVPTVLAGWFLGVSDRYFILYYDGEFAVGLYGIADRFANVLSVAIGAMSIAYTSFAFDKKDDANAKQQYARLLNAFFLITMTLCIIVMMFGKEIIHIMTDKAYYDSYNMLLGLIFGTLLYGINVLVVYGINFMKKTVFTLISTSSGAVVNIILNIIFIPKYGAIAASYTTFIGYFTMMLMTYYFAQKLYPVNYKMVRLIAIIMIEFVMILLTIILAFSLTVRILIAIVAISLLFVAYRDALRDVKILIDLCLSKFKK